MADCYISINQRMERKGITMQDLKRTPVYKKHIRKPVNLWNEAKFLGICFFVMVGTVYALVYFADYIDNL